MAVYSWAWREVENNAPAGTAFNKFRDQLIYHALIQI
jgi:hypothetical protein